MIYKTAELNYKLQKLIRQNKLYSMKIARWICYYGTKHQKQKHYGLYKKSKQQNSDHPVNLMLKKRA